MIASLSNLMKLITLLILLVVYKGVQAESGQWLGAERNRWSDTEYRKVKNDFGGWLLVTSDRDWQQKWSTQPDTVPYYNEADAVQVGKQLSILLFFVNPKPNEENHVSILCDIKVIRPDQSISIDERGVSCMSGELRGNPNYIRLSPIVINFLGEDSDPLGEWIVEFMVTDVFRNTTLHLKSSFTLEQE